MCAHGHLLCYVQSGFEGSPCIPLVVPCRGGHDAGCRRWMATESMVRARTVRNHTSSHTHPLFAVPPLHLPLPFANCFFLFLIIRVRRRTATAIHYCNSAYAHLFTKSISLNDDVQRADLGRPSSRNLASNHCLPPECRTIAELEGECSE